MFDAGGEARIQIHFPLIKSGRVFALDHDVFFNPVGHHVLHNIHVGQDSRIDDSGLKNLGSHIIYFLGKGGSELHPISVFLYTHGFAVLGGNGEIFSPGPEKN